MSDETTADAARTEMARQAVILVFSVVGVVVYVWAQRHASDPDATRTIRMRASKGGERFYARLAGWAWRQAERARLAGWAWRQAERARLAGWAWRQAERARQAYEQDSA